MKKKFSIYINNNEDIKAVEVGWSWPAFIFNFIWSACMKLWLVTIISLPALVALYCITANFALGSTNSIVTLAPSITNLAARAVFGYFGNSWKCKKLEKSGYVFSKFVTANNKENAISVYVNDENQQLL